jgi:hypothetical protein
MKIYATVGAIPTIASAVTFSSAHVKTGQYRSRLLPGIPTLAYPEGQSRRLSLRRLWSACQQRVYNSGELKMQDIFTGPYS